MNRLFFMCFISPFVHGVDHRQLVAENLHRGEVFYALTAYPALPKQVVGTLVRPLRFEAAAGEQERSPLRLKGVNAAPTVEYGVTAAANEPVCFSYKIGGKLASGVHDVALNDEGIDRERAAEHDEVRHVLGT